MTILQTRLAICLQTLLDLQPALPRARKSALANDFIILRDYLDKIKKMDLCEEDVTRLEFMANRFMQELKLLDSAQKLPGNWQ